MLRIVSTLSLLLQGSLLTNSHLNTRLCKDVESGLGHETSTEQKGFLASAGARELLL